MKHILMKKFGPYLGILALSGLVLGFAFAPSSCTLTPEQRERLRVISVPLTRLGLKLAAAEGWIEPGDKLVIKDGVAVLLSEDGTTEKVFKLAELGLDLAIKDGVLVEGDVITVESDKMANVATPLIPPTSAKEPVLQLSPPPGG